MNLLKWYLQVHRGFPWFRKYRRQSKGTNEFPVRDQTRSWAAFGNEPVMRYCSRLDEISRKFTFLSTMDKERPEKSMGKQ